MLVIVCIQGSLEIKCLVSVAKKNNNKPPTLNTTLNWTDSFTQSKREIKKHTNLILQVFELRL